MRDALNGNGRRAVGGSRSSILSGEKIGYPEREEGRERGKTGGNKLDVQRLTVWANARRLGRSKARAAL